MQQRRQSRLPLISLKIYRRSLAMRRRLVSQSVSRIFLTVAAVVAVWSFDIVDRHDALAQCASCVTKARHAAHRCAGCGQQHQNACQKGFQHGCQGCQYGNPCPCDYCRTPQQCLCGSYAPVQQDLFSSYYVGPSNCGGVPAQLYLSPHPTPPMVGHTYITYQPLMPHEFLYRHKRKYVKIHACGGGKTTTSITWY